MNYYRSIVLLLFRSLLYVHCSSPLFVFADEPIADVLPIVGPRFQAQLTSIDAHGLASFDSGQSLPLHEIVRYGNPAVPRPQPLVLLNGGSRIVAAATWTGGASLALTGEELILQSDVLNELRIPRAALRGIVFAESRHVDERRRLEGEIWAAIGPDTDEVMLTNGERLRGKTTKIDRGTLTMMTSAGEAKLPLSRVKFVVFEAGRTESQVRESLPRFAIGLRDGTLLQGQSIVTSDRELKVPLSNDGITVSGGSGGDIVVLQTLRSSQLAYLSDLEPTNYRHVPYLSIHWPFRRDENVLGRPMMVRGELYMKGLGLHSASRLTYSLDPSAGWRRFDASVAVDDTAQGQGSVTFGVHVHRDGQWQPAFTSGMLRGGDRPVDASVDLTRATGLTLTVDFADRGDELDHANWLDARLVK